MKPNETLSRLRATAISVRELAEELDVPRVMLQNVLYGQTKNSTLLYRANMWLGTHEANPTPFWTRVVEKRLAKKSRARQQKWVGNANRW